MCKECDRVGSNFSSPKQGTIISYPKPASVFCRRRCTVFFSSNRIFLVFQRRDGAEAIRRPSDPRDELLWSQQNVLPLVQTVSEHRQTQTLTWDRQFLYSDSYIYFLLNTAEIYKHSDTSPEHSRPEYSWAARKQLIRQVGNWFEGKN